ncbi:MAG TPA: hypothetical protein PLI59_05660 [Candidatus Obscuribacter sp.]|nr:hypothetical protein [Candidatus Obscuribacter sp.]
MSSNENESLRSKLRAVGNNPLAWVAIIIAMCAMMVIKPAQYLRREAYDKAGGLSWLLGIVASAAAGIAVGHHVGWELNLDAWWWLPLGLLSVVVTYCYAYPLTYLGLFQWSFKAGRKLWERVPDAGSRTNEYGFSPWFSNLLLNLSRVAVVIAGFILWYNLADGIQGKIGWETGFFHFVGWVIGAIVGGIISFIAGALSMLLLDQVGVMVIAGASGAYIVNAYTPAMSAYLAPYGLPAWTVHLAQGAAFIAYCAYVFPIAHLTITAVFRGLGEWLERHLGRLFRNLHKVFEWAYDDSDKNYVGFLQQAGAIALTAYAGTYAWGYLTAGLGFTLIPAILALVAVVLVAYIIIGGLASLVHVGFFGVVTCIIGAVLFARSGIYFGTELGTFATICVGVGAFLALAVVLYPVTYCLVKLLVNPLLASWLGGPLTTMHRTLSEEIFRSFSRTYEDNTDFAPLFAHLTNIALTVAAFLGLSMLMAALSFSAVTSIVVTGLTTASVYLLGGKLLTRYKNGLIGTLVSLAAGLYFGVEAYVHFDHSYWYGIGGFLVTGAATFLIGYPVAYVVLRAVLNVVAVTAWLLPVVGGIHGFFFGFVDAFWTLIVKAYRAIEASMRPYWQWASQLWDDSWAAAMEVVRHVFGSKNDK